MPNPPSTPPIALVAICGPTCSGKTYLSAALRDSDPRFTSVVTTTTRDPRPGEVHSVDYHFVTHATFRAKLANGALLEHDRVGNHFYGIESAELERIVASGRIGVAVITPSGIEPARTFCQSVGTSLLTVFVSASPETLVMRLLQRFSAHREDRASDYACRLVHLLDTLPSWLPDRYDVAEPSFGSDTLSDLVRRIQDAIRRPTRRAVIPLRAEAACALQTR